jgi:SPP1 family predicted phage head-tail adaptor
MRAGSLRHVGTIEEPTKSQDSTGAIVPSWATFADSVRAEIEPISGREFFSASQVQSNVNTKIRIRRIEGVTAKMRFVHDSDIYDIQAVLLDKTGLRELHLMCVKRGAQGFRKG